jgi:hypothetical protein
VTAVPRFALGFFIAYCVLAAFTSALLRRSAKRPAAERLPGGSKAAAVLLLPLALAAGIGAGLHGSFHLLNPTDEVADATLIKLVQTHQELLQDKFKAGPGHPAVIPFEVPFRAALNVDLRLKEGIPLLVSVVPNDGRAVDAVPPPEPVRAFPIEETRSYHHTASVPAGKYWIVVRANPLEKDPDQTRSFSLRLSIDP